VQIQYIFSDKTGTLTQNQMEFKKASFGPLAKVRATTTENRATTASSRLLFFWGDHFWHLNMITLPRQARDKYSIAKTHLNNVSFRPLGLPRGRLARLGRICLASYRRLGSWR